MKDSKILAKAYVNVQYIDYGDLNESAERQIKEAFIAGFNSGKKLKWINVNDNLPKNNIELLIKTQDYRRPKENVTDITLGYFENNTWFYENSAVVNDGNGWHIISYMELPK